MDPTDQSPEEVYSVWALPPEPVRDRLRSLMAGLRAAHGGPAFEPHATVVGAIRLRRSTAIEALRAAAAGVRPYTARVASVARGGFFFLLLEPTPEVMEASDHCCAHFGYQRSTPYTPHVSLLYADLTDEEKEAARRKVEEMDKEICGLQFEISELALYRTDTEDKSLESWELVESCQRRNPSEVKRSGATFLEHPVSVVFLEHPAGPAPCRPPRPSRASLELPSGPDLQQASVYPGRPPGPPRVVRLLVPQPSATPIVPNPPPPSRSRSMDPEQKQ